MRVFIVHAHPEPKSFNGALTREAVSALGAAGHEVVISDLWAMGFNPVSGRHNFLTVKDPEVFRQQAEEAHAAACNGFAAEVQAEQDKLFWCDALILQFPLWWFGLPAILKGWVDRVFAAGLTYGAGRFYSNGVFKGKRAMLSLTTGGPPTMYSPRGLNGDVETLLFPINHGILHFVGFDVLPPFIAYAVARANSEQRATYLRTYEERLRNWHSTPPLVYPPLSHYDESLQLKPEVAS